MSIRITDLPYSNTIAINDVFPFVAIADAGGVGITKHADFATLSQTISSHLEAGSAFVTPEQMNAALGNAGVNYSLINAISAALANILMPVGTLFTTTTNTNPAVLLNFGTWTRYAEGRCIVGYTAADTDFNAGGKTGGAKSVTLTEAQLPSHRHGIQGFGITTANRTPEIIIDDDRNTGVYNRYTDYTGGGQAHDNMQPYIVAYIWRRSS